VLGFDPARAQRAYRERIGVVLQQSQLWSNLTVRETHRLFAGYYREPRDVDEVIDLIGLGPKRDARVKTLSGGQKRRLDLGVALVGDPDLVFLDEPTTGFDPAARRAAWEMIRSLRSLGKTILLTTHYLDEASSSPTVWPSCVKDASSARGRRPSSRATRARRRCATAAMGRRSCFARPSRRGSCTS
jgi:ABC-2 type transport system ATP-binding protein